MVRQLDPIDNGRVHLAVVECNCGYHMTWDASWLLARDDDDRWPVTQRCPSCSAIVSYHVDDEVTIETREEIRAAADAIMARDAPTRYKTAKTIREYKAVIHGYHSVIPVGTTVTNKTACGFDDNYRFCAPWEGMPDGIRHDLEHYGINVPAEYCEPYPENNYVAP